MFREKHLKSGISVMQLLKSSKMNIVAFKQITGNLELSSTCSSAVSFLSIRMTTKNQLGKYLKISLTSVPKPGKRFQLQRRMFVVVCLKRIQPVDLIWKSFRKWNGFLIKREGHFLVYLSLALRKIPKLPEYARNSTCESKERKREDHQN